MSIKTNRFIWFTLLIVLALVVACGAQPETTSQDSDHHHDDEAHQETGHDEHDEADHDHEAESEKHEDVDHHAEDEHAHHDETDHAEAPSLSAISLADGEKLQVVATTNIVADLVNNVAGDMIDLTAMLPIGANPHTFDPTPQDIAMVSDAQVVFVNGLHLEEFLEKLIENAGGEAAVVPLSTQVKTLNFEATEAHAEDEHGDDADHEDHEHEADEHADEDEHDHHHEGVDPHIWMTPVNVIVMVHNVEQALSQLDPANAEQYQANAESYIAQLETLDTWIESQIETIPADNRQLVTDHHAFGYYVEQYGLTLVGAVIPAYSDNAEPSAKELADLQDSIAEVGVQAIFVGTTVNPALAERVAEDMDINLVPLYTGSLGEPGSGAENYLDYMRYNTTAIVEALK